MKINELKDLNIRQFKNLCVLFRNKALIANLDDINYFLAPASIRFHNNCPGGLFDHSLNVSRMLKSLAGVIGPNTFQRKDSPYIIGMLHDVCKCDDYEISFNDDNVGDFIIGKTPGQALDGHGDKSLIMLHSILAGTGIQLTEEEIMCIRWHMGAFETDRNRWACYGNAVEVYPNVLMTHTADMYANHILETR